MIAIRFFSGNTPGNKELGNEHYKEFGGTEFLRIRREGQVDVARVGTHHLDRELGVGIGRNLNIRRCSEVLGFGIVDRHVNITTIAGWVRHPNCYNGSIVDAADHRARVNVDVFGTNVDVRQGRHIEFLEARLDIDGNVKGLNIMTINAMNDIEATAKVG